MIKKEMTDVILSVVTDENFDYATKISKLGYTERNSYNVPKIASNDILYVVAEVIRQGHIKKILKKANITVSIKNLQYIYGSIMCDLPKNIMKPTATNPIYLGWYRVPNTQFLIEIDYQHFSN